MPIFESNSVYICSLPCNCRTAASKVSSHNLDFDLEVKLSITEIFYPFSITKRFFFVSSLIL